MVRPGTGVPLLAVALLNLRAAPAGAQRPPVPLPAWEPAAPVGAQQGRHAAPDGTVSTLVRRGPTARPVGRDSVRAERGSVLVVRAIDTVDGTSGPRGVRHAVRGDTVEVVEVYGPRAVISPFTPERFDARVRRLRPGAYWLRYAADPGDGTARVLFERRVVVPR